MKICMLASAFAICIFGAYTLKDEVYRILPQQTAEIREKNGPDADDAGHAPESERPTFKHPQLIVDGELTEGTNSLAFIHENGFEVGKKRYRDAGPTPDVQDDGNGRLLRYSIRMDAGNLAMYSVKPETEPVEPHAFANGAPEVMLTDCAWRHAVQPYLNALTTFARDTDSPLVLVVECRYGADGDTIPRYIDLKAFTPDDLGESCSIWVTFHNADPDRRLDYATGRWLSMDIVTPDAQGGDIDG